MKDVTRAAEEPRPVLCAEDRGIAKFVWRDVRGDGGGDLEEE